MVWIVGAELTPLKHLNLCYPEKTNVSFIILLFNLAIKKLSKLNTNALSKNERMLQYIYIYIYCICYNIYTYIYIL